MMTKGQWLELEEVERRKLVAEKLDGWTDFAEYHRRGLVGKHPDRPNDRQRENVPRYESWIDEGAIFDALRRLAERKGEAITIEVSWDATTGFYASIWMTTDQEWGMDMADATATEFPHPGITRHNQIIVLAAMRLIGEVEEYGH